MFRGKTNASRRRLLQYLGATSVLTGLGIPAVQAARGPELAHVFGDSQASPSASLRALGEAYLREHPAERSKHALLSAIKGHPAFAACRKETTQETDYRTMIQEDFAVENTVALHGWVLSRTEARLAALAIV